MVARSTKDPSDGFVGHAVISGNLAQGFVVFTDTADHVGPFFRWDAMVRLTWTWTLLCRDERGNTPQDLLEGKKSLRELAVWGEKVDQHW